MTYTLKNIIASIAAQLKEVWPTVPVYDSRTFQATNYPCFFIQLMPSRIADEIDGRELREIGLDVVYIQQRNLVAASGALLEVADQLDELLDYVQYTDGDGLPVPLHTHDRSYSVEDQELHYKLTLRNRVSRPVDAVKINTVEDWDVEIKE